MSKTVLITGAARGIGSEIARVFSHQGWNVALHYYKSKQQALHTAQSLSTNVLPVCADLRDEMQVNQMVHSVTDHFVKIDALVNNAGIAQQKLFTDLTKEDWKDMFDVNVTGAFYTTKAVLPQMISDQAGSIVMVSSIWGMVGASMEVHYSAAKAALIGMTKALAKEVGPCQIRVNCVAPGVIDTDMIKDVTPEVLGQLKEQTPFGRIGAPSDVAELVYYLCSSNASFITGQVLSPNGGFVI